MGKPNSETEQHSKWHTRHIGTRGAAGGIQAGPRERYGPCGSLSDECSNMVPIYHPVLYKRVAASAMHSFVSRAKDGTEMIHNGEALVYTDNRRGDPPNHGTQHTEQIDERPTNRETKSISPRGAIWDRDGCRL